MPVITYPTTSGSEVKELKSVVKVKGDKSGKKSKNLIAISGKIGSGKDTVGEIIRYLTHPQKLSHFEKWGNSFEIGTFLYHKSEGIESNYIIKRFADPLKDIVCILIGCTREELEDHSFKETPLGSQWNKYRVNVSFRHGNDQYFYFDDKQKAEVFAKTNLSFVEKIALTPRKFMQLIGTRCIRDIMHPDAFLNALFAEYKRNLYDREWFNKPPHWIITDLRFRNEAEAVQKENGLLIRVNRNSSTKDLNKKSQHISETDLDNYESFDYVIDNDGNLNELIDKVKDILDEEGIRTYNCR